MPGPSRLEDAWRRDGGRLVAALARRFRDLDLAEECLAEAAARAQAHWTQPPDNPSGWLYRAALRIGIDRLRAKARRPAAEIEALADEVAAATPETPDDRLALYFLCCHPAIGADAQIALMLRLLAGLSVEDIARAFLAEPAAILQRITRAKKKLAAAKAPFDPPAPQNWPERLPRVLTALSIIYERSYADIGGGVEPEALAREAMALSQSLAELTDDPEAHGLAATIRFCESRRPARLDEDGAMTPLDRQNASLWRMADIEAAATHLEAAARGKAPGPWQIKALIHAAHARRKRDGVVPWQDIVALYAMLLRVEPTPVVALNAAVARAGAGDVASALGEIEALAAAHGLDGWQPVHAARAELLARLGRNAEAGEAFARAALMTPGRSERLYLEARARALA